MVQSLQTAFRRFFLDHPHSQGMTYTEHMSHALSYAKDSFVAAGALTLHAFLPGILQTTGSDRIKILANKFTPRSSNDVKNE